MERIRSIWTNLQKKLSKWKIWYLKKIEIYLLVLCITAIFWGVGLDRYTINKLSKTWNLYEKKIELASFQRAWFANSFWSSDCDNSFSCLRMFFLLLKMGKCNRISILHLSLGHVTICKSAFSSIVKVPLVFKWSKREIANVADRNNSSFNCMKVDKAGLAPTKFSH